MQFVIHRIFVINKHAGLSILYVRNAKFLLITAIEAGFCVWFEFLLLATKDDEVDRIDGEAETHML